MLTAELAKVDFGERLGSTRNVVKGQLHQMPSPYVASGFECREHSGRRTKSLLHDRS